MIGLRIYGRATFDQIFRPVLHMLDGLVWVFAFRDLWRFPEEWEDASEFDAETGVYTSGPLAEFNGDLRPVDRTGSYLVELDILRKYARAIDDGQCIFGVRMSREAAASWLDRVFWGKPSYAEAVNDAEVSFVGDESCWEFYAKDESLLAALKAHLSHAREVPANHGQLPIDAAYEECWSRRDDDLYRRLFDAVEPTEDR
jgi:hypothetical protein